MALTYVNQISAPEGLNQAMPATTLPESYVRWAQDALFDQVGTIRRRGPFGLISLTDSTGANASQPTPVTSTTAERVLGTVGTKNPLGVQVLALFVHNNAVDAVDPSSRATIAEAIKVYAYDSSYRTKSTSTVRTFAATDADFTCDSTAIFYSTPALGGGAWISILDDYIPASSSNAQTLVYWRGGVGKEATAGLSCTIGVTGSGDPSTYTDQITSSALFGDITSGMFAFDVVGGEDYYLGMVKSVDSTSAITLEKKALRTALGATDDASANTTSRTVRFTNTRPYIHNHGRGLLTSPVPASGSTITSGNEGGSGEGHWKSAGLGATWALYKNSDHTWVGNIATITNNASGTLSATHFNSALTAFANEEYVAYPVSYTMSANAQAGVNQRSTQKFGGVFAATYQGYQWYANCGVGDKGNRIVFSASSNPESVDLSKDAADSIELPGTKEIRGIATSSAGLLVFTADKAYIIRGNERNNFSLEELYPEGCLCTSSIVEYGGGVFWVGKSGFLLYDGGSVRLLTKDNLGIFYTDSIKNFDASVDRVYSFFYKNYLFVYFTIFQTPFTPQRYEPLYVTGWTTTSGIDDLQWSALDDAFEWDDFKNDSKTPVYWDSQKMFETIGAEAQGIAATFDTNGTVFGLDATGVYKFGPLNLTDGMVFALYLPTGSITTLSNMDFRGAAILETANGTNCLLGVTADTTSYIVTNASLSSTTATITIGTHSLPVGTIVTVSGIDPDNYNGTYTITAVAATTISYTLLLGGTYVSGGTVTADGAGLIRARIIDLDPVIDTNTVGRDPILIYNNVKTAALYRKGPDFYMQTKAYTVGDPVLKKWFQRLLINMKLNDGAVRFDIVDDEDNDDVNITLKSHRNWEVFTPKGYNWSYVESTIFPKYVASNSTNWGDVYDQEESWVDLLDPAFERFKKRFSWRSNSAGIRLYQLNDYEAPNTPDGTINLPNDLIVSSWNVGFKPMREGRL
jgi:hypothetical protein